MAKQQIQPGDHVLYRDNGELVMAVAFAVDNERRTVTVENESGWRKDFVVRYEELSRPGFPPLPVWMAA